MEVIHQIMLGTKNGAKIHGVQRAFRHLQDVLESPDLADPETWSCQVDTGVSEEPWGFPATIQGAQNRAQAAYAQLPDLGVAAGQIRLGIGVESGFIDVATVTFTLYNFDVCALFDGQQYYLGISPGFEYPRRLVHNIFLHRQPFQQARQYITTTADIERQTGIIGELSRGLTNRADMTNWATQMALIRYLRRHDYDHWN